jgi:iron complex outermembrane receptor protein
MRLFLISALVLLLAKSWAQPNCQLSLSGQVLDKNTQKPLALAEVFIEQLQIGTLTDSAGRFTLPALCPDSYGLTVHHVGCQTVQRQVQFSANTPNLVIYLAHSQELLPGVTLSQSAVESDNGNTRKLNELINLEDAHAAELRLAKTGENVLKPIIRSFSGNRVSTFVGEVELQDQQWGSDHGLSLALYPDAVLSLNENSLNFGQLKLSGNNPFVEKAQFFSRAYSNGWGGQLGFLQNFHLLKSENKKQPSVAAGWRFQLNQSGDKRAPNYNLSNTGSQSINGQVDVSVKDARQKFRLDLSSSYDAKNLAVLRASHVGNASDFTAALNATQPFFIEEFNYNIDNPRQATAHYMASATAYYFGLNPQRASSLKLHYSYQNNQRQEFEARRGGNENPALNLRLQNHQIALGLKQGGWGARDYFELEAKQHFEINSNVPGTGFEPILPNYNSYKTSLNGSYTWQLVKRSAVNFSKSTRLQLVAGWQRQNSLAQFFNNAELNQQEFNFNTTAASLSLVNHKQGLKGQNFSLKNSSTVQFTQRPPALNELLISGVHHGTATIEEGALNLKPETKIGLSHSLDWQKNAFALKLSAYINYVDQFIYQRPLPQPRLTIRGTFPVFAFSQTNAFFMGAEAEGSYAFTNKIRYQGSLNYIYAQDVAPGGPLPLIPPFEWQNQLRFTQDFNATWQQAFVSVGHRYTARQNRFDPNLDLALPPAAYGLLNASIGISLQKKYRYVFSLSAQNLTNHSYRNYLNRFRYFVDAPGINLFIDCLIKFK